MAVPCFANGKLPEIAFFFYFPVKYSVPMCPMTFCFRGRRNLEDNFIFFLFGGTVISKHSFPVSHQQEDHYVERVSIPKSGL